MLRRSATVAVVVGSAVGVAASRAAAYADIVGVGGWNSATDVGAAIAGAIMPAVGAGPAACAGGER